MGGGYDRVQMWPEIIHTNAQRSPSLSKRAFVATVVPIRIDAIRDVSTGVPLIVNNNFN